MKLSEFISLMDEIAPRELALGFDNSGLIVDTDREEISRVLIALDCTEAVAREAESLGCELVLTHHPLLFNAVKRISPKDPITAPVYRLIRSDIALFAAHTNLDIVEGGVNTQLCRLLGIENEIPVPPENLIRIGRLSNKMRFTELAHLVERVLGASVRLAGDDDMVETVCVCGGSGGSEYMLAVQNGADALITGECKHNQAIEAVHAGLKVIVAGHYETERIALFPLMERLRERADGVELILSKAEVNPLRTL